MGQLDYLQYDGGLGFDINWKGLGIFVLVVMGIILLAMPGWYPMRSAADLTITVKDYGLESGGTKYLVWSEEGEVFCNVDNWIAGKTNSSDVQGAIKKGYQYRVHVIGWRNTPLSQYRNIMSIEEVTPEVKPQPDALELEPSQSALAGKKQFCPDCGTKVKKENKYCAQCGKKL